MANRRGCVKWLVVAVSLCTSGVLSAEPAVSKEAAQRAEQNRYLEAAAAAQRGDYVVAYCFWRPLAEQGDAEAQYALGWMYHNGYGLVADDLAAKGWWEKAVAQGHADAMFSLGTLYSVGSEAVVRDYAAAMRLWLQATRAGNENARFALRELALRNLPELSPLTQSLRAQYPMLLGDITPRKHVKTRLNKHSKVDVDNGQNGAFGMKLRGEEWIAIAAGYRPEYGWAAAHLLREGGMLIAAIPRR